MAHKLKIDQNFVPSKATPTGHFFPGNNSPSD